MVPGFLPRKLRVHIFGGSRRRVKCRGHEGGGGLLKQKEAGKHFRKLIFFFKFRCPRSSSEVVISQRTFSSFPFSMANSIKLN